MMKLNWIKGRQEGTHYYKLPLWSFKVFKYGFDAYVLKYIAPTFLSVHTDPVRNAKHYRLNIKLYGHSVFKCEGRHPSDATFEMFRPDLLKHSLDVYSDTLKLSFGFAKYE